MTKAFDSYIPVKAKEPIAPFERSEHRAETEREINESLGTLTSEVDFQKQGIAEAMADSDPVERERRVREWEAWGTELRGTIGYLKASIMNLPLEARKGYSDQFDDLWNHVRATRRPGGHDGPTTKIHSRRK